MWTLLFDVSVDDSIMDSFRVAQPENAKLVNAMTTRETKGIFIILLYATDGMFGRIQLTSSSTPPSAVALAQEDQLSTRDLYTLEVSHAIKVSSSPRTDSMARRTTIASSIFPKIGTESGMTSKGETK